MDQDNFDGSFNLVNFFVQLTDQAYGVLKLHRLGWHSGADGSSGCLADLNSFLPIIMTFRCIRQHRLEVGQMGVGNLPSAGELAENRVD